MRSDSFVRVRARARVLVVAALLGVAAFSCGSEDSARGPAPPKKGAPPPPPPNAADVAEIAAGSFEMGHPLEEQGPYGSDWYMNETPAHRVTLSAFAVDRSEVTVAEYAAFLAARGGAAHHSPLMPIDASADGTSFSPKRGSERVPIAYVTWFDARAYCTWRGAALPTEAQWERAAKGAAEPRVFPWGNEGPTCARAVFFTGESACEAAPVDVATHRAGDSPDGIHDLAGNVAEWTADGYGPYAKGAADDPVGAEDAPYRVIRGGGHRDVPHSLRTTARWPGAPRTRSPGVGIRCAWRR